MRRYFRIEHVAFLPFRIAIILIGIIAISYFLVFLFLKSPYGIEFVSNKIKETVEGLGLKIELKAIRLDIFNAELNLNDFELIGSQNRALASLKGLKVSLSLPYLMFGKIVITDFHLRGVDGEIIVENGKITNLPAFSSTKKRSGIKRDGPEQMPDITIERFSISSINVRLKYEDIIDSQVRIQEISGSYVSRSAEFSFENLDAKVFVRDNTYSVNLNMRAAYLNDSIILRGLELTLDGRKVLSATGEIKEIRDPLFNLDINANLMLGYLKNYPVGMKRAEGEISIKAKFRGRLNAPIIEGYIAARDMVIEQFRIGRIEGNIVFDNGDMQINDLRVDNFGNRFTINASGGIKNKIRLMGNVGIKRLELAELLRNLGVNSIVMLDIQGLIDFDFSIDEKRGVIVDARPVLSLKGPTVFSDYYFSPRRGEPVFNLKGANLSGEVSVTQKGVELKGVDISTERSRVVVKNSFIGFIGDGYMDLKATSNSMDFSDISPVAGLNMRGISSLSAVLKGPFSSLKITGDVDAHGLFIEQFYGGSVKLSVEFFNNLLSFKNISGRVNDMAYTGDVVLNMNGDPDLEVDAEIKDASLKSAISLLPQSIRVYGVEKGRLSAGVNLSGSINRLSGEIEANMNDLKLFGEKVDRIDTVILLEGGDFILKDLTINLYNGMISSRGTLKKDGEMDFAVDVSGIEIASSENIQSLPIRLSGLFGGSAKIAGDLKRPVVDFDGKIQGLTAGFLEAQDLSIKARLEENIVRAHSALKDGSIVYELQNEEDRPQVYRMKTEIRGLDIGRLFMEENNITTSVDMAADFLWNAKTKDFSGSVSTNSLFVKLYDMKFRLAKPFFFSLSNGDISYGDIDIAGEDIKIQINGSQFNPAAVNINGKGVIPLSILKGLSKDTLSATGSLNVDFSVYGNIWDPNISMSGSVSNSLIKLSFFPHPFENTSLKFFMQKNTLSISELKGSIAGGSFDGSGEIRLEKYIPSNLDVRLDINRAFLSFPRDLPSIVSGYLTINGDLKRLLLGGEIDIEKATYNRNVDFNTLLVDLTRKRPKFTSYSKENEFVFFDIGLKAPSGIFVKNNLVVDSEFKADLRLVGSNERIGIVGTINAIRARMVLSGNEYILKRGIVQLTERYRIAYNLDILLSTVCHDTNSGLDHNIEMSISGNDENIRIQYKDNTTPPFSETDIITCLALGITPQKLGTQDRSTQQESLGLISSMSGVDQKLKDVIPIPIETFRISSKYSDTLKMNIPQVQVSWRLMPNLKLNYSSALIYTQDQKIELDYKLNQKTSVRTQWNSQAQVPVGNLGVDIKWNWEF